MVSELAIRLDDVVGLDAHVAIENDHLRDLLTGRAHPVNGTAHHIVRQLRTGADLRQVVDSYQSAFGLDVDTALRDVLAVLESCDSAALLVVRRNWSTRLRPWSLYLSTKTALSLGWGRPPARRAPATFWGLAMAVARSSRAGAISAVIAGIALAGVLFAVNPSSLSGPATLKVLLYCATPVGVYLVMAVQFGAHEGGHLLAARGLGHVSYLTTRGLQMSLAHASTRDSGDRMIALAGPVCGLLAAAVCVAIGVLAGLPPMFSTLMAGLGVPHVWSLTPWSTDGRMVWGRARINPVEAR